MNLDQYWRGWLMKVIEGDLTTERPVWLVFLVSSLFDVISFGLSLGAQSRRNKVDWEFDEDGNFWYCKYSADTASGMAATAFCLLLVGTLVIMGATRCFCCNVTHLPGGSRLCAVLLFTLCWLFFGIAEVLLLAGANRNAVKTRTEVVAGAVVPTCEQIRSTIFAAAASFTFLTWIVSQLYYVCEVKCRLLLHPPSSSSSQYFPHHHHHHQHQQHDPAAAAAPPPPSHSSPPTPISSTPTTILVPAPPNNNTLFLHDIRISPSPSSSASTAAAAAAAAAARSAFLHSSSNHHTLNPPHFFYHPSISTPSPAPPTYMNI